MLTKEIHFNLWMNEDVAPLLAQRTNSTIEDIDEDLLRGAFDMGVTAERTVELLVKRGFAQSR